MPRRCWWATLLFAAVPGCALEVSSSAAEVQRTEISLVGRAVDQIRDPHSRFPSELTKFHDLHPTFRFELTNTRDPPPTLRFELTNDTAGVLALESPCDRSCGSVRLERLAESGVWESSSVTADAEQSIPPGSSLTLEVQTLASAWSPGDYRLTVRLLDESSLPLDVIREFSVDAWPGETVRRALEMLRPVQA